MQHNESLWLARAQKGDPEAFSRLVEMYQSPVYNLCFRMLNDADDAEDAAQETFLRAYRSMKSYDHQRPFPTWLLSIAAHHCIDQMRKRRMSIVSIEDLPYADLPDGSPNPETATGQLEEQGRVRALLGTLTPLDRAAVVMYYWYEFSYEDIGEALNLSISAVKSRLHRARRSMAEAWSRENQQTQIATRNDHGEVQSPAF